MTLLAICIPTYNRAAKLERLLGAIERELAGRDDVVVLVSDNASSDETADVLAAAASRLPLIAHRQASNVGAIENIRWLIANAEADYLWGFGDDDLPESGAVARVVEILGEERPAWLHLPHRWVEGGTLLPGGSPCPEAVERYADAGRLWCAYGHWLTFYSAEVLERTRLQAVAAAYPTTNLYAPLVWFFRAAADGRCVVADSYLVAGDLEISWRDVRSLTLTRGFTGLFDEAIGLRVSPQEFAATLDELYTPDEFLELWRSPGLDELAEAVRRFPHSVRLRAFLWHLAREAGRRDLIDVLSAAGIESGATGQARAVVAEGERRFEEGDARGAAVAFSAAVGMQPTIADAWSDLAVALHALGLPGADEAITVALDLDPEHVEARENRLAILGY